MIEPTHNQEYREDLHAHGECRDCEAPLLADERDGTRCGVCRVKRQTATARKRGAGPAAMEGLAERFREARRERVRVLGHDDGAGDRKAVRAFLRRGVPRGRQHRRGETMGEKRARWTAEGRCRDCGAPLDRPGESNKCARHRASRNRANHLRRSESFTVVLASGLALKVREDAEARGETPEEWIAAAVRDSFEPEEEAEE